MRLSNPFAIKSVALAISGLLRLWMSTLNLRFVISDENANPLTSNDKLLYLFWHEMLVLPSFTHANTGIPVLVSHHRDGELVAQVVRMLRGRTMRGSTTRGGAAALKELVRAGKVEHLALTPDGPKGPRRVVKEGAIYLASRAGMKIVPLGLAYRACWRLSSWDKFALPKPNTLAVYVVGDSISIPSDLDRQQIESIRQEVQTVMDQTQAQAEQLSRNWPPQLKWSSLPYVLKSHSL